MAKTKTEYILTKKEFDEYEKFKNNYELERGILQGEFGKNDKTYFIMGVIFTIICLYSIDRTFKYLC